MTETAKSSTASASDERTSYLPGQVIGDKYRLEKQVGEGGMASVWLATNFVLDVAVAIKLIRADTESDDSGWRMLQEARAVARLGHPAIVRIFDFGQTSDGSPFIAMEYLHGETLADRLDREASIPAVKAVQLLLPIADGLATAHSKQIVHRDLKPENIFLARDEAGRLQPKVLDFGIAKLDNPKGKVTLAGDLLGSPDYMAPEQALGQDDVDHRTDVWAFCVVLYEMLCGLPPFEGSNYNALLRAIINDPPTPITEHGAGDDDLWRIMETGLNKDPEQRWDSVRDLGEALAYWLFRRGVTEDVCAASLTTTWLESGYSGVSLRPRSGIPPAARGAGAISVAPASGTRSRPSQPSTGSDRPAAKLVSVVPRQVAHRSSIRGALLGAVVTAIAIGLAVVLVYHLSSEPPREGSVESVSAVPGPANALASEGTAQPAAASEADEAEADGAASAEPTSSADAATTADPKQRPVAPRRRVVPRKSSTKKGSRPNEIDMGF